VASAASCNSKISHVQEELIRRQESPASTSADPAQHLFHILLKKGRLIHAGIRVKDSSLSYGLRTLLPKK